MAHQTPQFCRVVFGKGVLFIVTMAIQAVLFSFLFVHIIETLVVFIVGQGGGTLVWGTEEKHQNTNCNEGKEDVEE